MEPNRALADVLERIALAARRSLDSDAVSDYEQLDQWIHELERVARQQFEEANRGLYEDLADKIEQGAPLSAVELGALELLIVGEAKYYLKAERNYPEWKARLNRLVEEIGTTSADSTTDTERLLRLQALSRDARGVMPDITRFLRERDRLERFRTATGAEMSLQDSRFLAALIRQMVSSNRRASSD